MCMWLKGPTSQTASQRSSRCISSRNSSRSSLSSARSSSRNSARSSSRNSTRSSCRSSSRRSLRSSVRSRSSIAKLRAFTSSIVPVSTCFDSVKRPSSAKANKSIPRSRRASRSKDSSGPSRTSLPQISTSPGERPRDRWRKPSVESQSISVSATTSPAKLLASAMNVPPSTSRTLSCLALVGGGGRGGVCGGDEPRLLHEARAVCMMGA
mmetsp:Transcript_35854/g.83429  ORF Transcript_35854/g.83429 Transcript_35854/m.83429 type:complete len:210 (+) Transcript_35854:103-732(+)